MASCPHYSSLCLSVVFSFCLGLSLTRRSSLALSLSLARARSLLLEGSSTFVPSRTPLTSQPAGMVSCSHPLSSSLLISGSSSLSLSFLSSLSHARALAHALGLVTSRVLEDTIDTPTGSNGVLPSLPAVFAISSASQPGATCCHLHWSSTKQQKLQQNPLSE